MRKGSSNLEMSCEQVRGRLIAYLQRDLPSQEQEEIARHVASCDACHGEAYMAERLDSELRLEAARQDLRISPQASDRIWRRLSLQIEKWSRLQPVYGFLKITASLGMIAILFVVGSSILRQWRDGVGLLVYPPPGATLRTPPYPLPEEKTPVWVLATEQAQREETFFSETTATTRAILEASHVAPSKIDNLELSPQYQARLPDGSGQGIVYRQMPINTSLDAERAQAVAARLGIVGEVSSYVGEDGATAFVVSDGKSEIHVFSDSPLAFSYNASSRPFEGSSCVLTPFEDRARAAEIFMREHGLLDFDYRIETVDRPMYSDCSVSIVPVINGMILFENDLWDPRIYIIFNERGGIHLVTYRSLAFSSLGEVPLRPSSEVWLDLVEGRLAGKIYSRILDPLTHQVIQESGRVPLPGFGPDPGALPPFKFIVEVVDLVYYAFDFRHMSVNPYPAKSSFRIVQPVWRFAGHTEDGREFEILVQAVTNLDGLPNASSGVQSTEIPTVLPTLPPGSSCAFVDPDDQRLVFVRSGPGMYYPKVGRLLPGSCASILGRTAQGDWLQVESPDVGIGWVFYTKVTVEGPLGEQTVQALPRIDALGAFDPGLPLLSKEACGNGLFLLESTDFRDRPGLIIGGDTFQIGDFTFDLWLHCDSGFNSSAEFLDGRSEIAGLGIYAAWAYHGAPVGGDTQVFYGIDPFIELRAGTDELSDGSSFQSNIGIQFPPGKIPDLSSVNEASLRFTYAVRTPAGQFYGVVLSFTLQRETDGFRPVNISVSFSPEGKLAP